MDIKKGILLQLFSGSRKDFDNSARSKFRSDILWCILTQISLLMFIILHYSVNAKCCWCRKVRVRAMSHMQLCRTTRVLRQCCTC